MSDGLRPDLQNIEEHLAARDAAIPSPGERLDPPFPYVTEILDPEVIERPGE